jgi:tRNA 2-thiouridine synthesizing protein A
MIMNLENIQPNSVLDTRGLTCPMPLLKTKKALKSMASGEILEILGTDPGSKKDIPDFGNKGGNQFVGMLDTSEGHTRYFIKKG